MRALALAIVTLLLAGCAAPTPSPAGNATAPSPSPAPTTPGPFAARSDAFADGEPIPAKHTCLGDNVSPPLLVTGAPARATHLALLMADPDAPSSATSALGLRNFTHWLVWNVLLADGAAMWPEDGVPNGSVQGQNGGGREEYAGPCPPIPGDPHRYIFTFHALDAALALEAGANRTALEQALEGHVLGTTSFHGIFTRPLGPPR